jgi:thioredoxin 1
MVPADPTIIREAQRGNADMSNATAVTDQDFEAEVINSPTPVLVDFWAEWCGPCRLIAPAVDQISAEYAGRLKVVKMNVDENPEIPIRFGIQGIPTLLLFKGGQVVEKIVGAAPKPALLARIKPHV